MHYIIYNQTNQPNANTYTIDLSNNTSSYATTTGWTGWMAGVEGVFEAPRPADEIADEDVAVKALEAYRRFAR